MTRLRSYDKFPPGGYDYRQTDGIPRYFDPQGGIRHLTGRVLDFRVANHLPRANWEEVFRDIELYVIARLGNDPQWVDDSELTPYTPVVRSRSKGGGCCGAKVP